MADDKELDNDPEKEAVKTGAKIAANAYAGPIGGKAVELASKTKLGNEVLNRTTQNLKNMNAGGAASAFTPKGNNDLLNKSRSKKTGDNDKSEGGNNEGLDDNSSKKKSSPSLLNDDKNDNKTQSKGDFSQRVFSYIKERKKQIIIAVSSVFLGLIFLFAIYFVVASIAGSVIGFFTEKWDQIVGYFKKTDQERIEEYYEKLEETKEKIYKKKHICIDENLLTATLTVDIDAEDYADESREDLPEDIEPEFDEVAEGEENANNDDYDFEITADEDVGEQYKKMQKEIDLLANMQIKTIKYGHNHRLLEDDDVVAPEGKIMIMGSYANRCWPENKEIEDEVVNDENLEDFDLPGFDFWTDLKVNGDFTSDSMEKVAKHDKVHFNAFWNKKAKYETNYEFTIYNPKIQTETDEDTGETYEICKSDLPDNRYELSIGDYATREESVYYWNLVNSFIPNYYEEYLPEAEPKRTEKIKKIADDIYLLYKDIGPGQTCYKYDVQEIICRSDEGSDFYTGDNGGTGPINGSSNEFFNRIAPIAIDEMSRTGLNASVIMAQAALESSWGKSGLSSKYANYYGMTSGCIDNKTYPPSKYKGKILAKDEEFNHCTGNAFWNGSVVAMCNKNGGDCQWYRIYDSFDSSTKDHSRLLLSSSRYAGCNQYRNPQDQIQCIKNGGYAEDPNYVSKVMNMINTYGLTKFDIGEWDGEYVEITTPIYQDSICFDYGELGPGGSGDWANWLQGDPRWKDLVISTKTIGQVGCALTSVAVQLARSGVATKLGGNLNPGTFMQYHKAHGGFSGNNIEWDVSDVAPDFRFVNNPNFTSISQLKSLVDQGYYLVLGVKNSGHWVAVDRVVGDTVYIYDSALRGGVRYTTANQYGVNTFTKIIIYEKVGK